MDKWIISNITQMITWLGFFSAVFFAYFYYLRFRNKERMLLIEKNVDLSEIYKKRETHFPWFMVGYSLLGIGLGFSIALSVALIIAQSQKIAEEIVVLFVVSASILFGAIGIIIGHKLEQRKKNLRG